MIKKYKIKIEDEKLTGHVTDNCNPINNIDENIDLAIK
jgi:hypothetical protein